MTRISLPTLSLRRSLILGVIFGLSATAASAQPPSPSLGSPPPDSAPAMPPIAQINAGRSPPNYPTPYVPTTVAAATEVAHRVLGYLEKAAPLSLDPSTTFRIVGYEWGVTYVGMLHAAAATGDNRFRDYALQHLHYIAEQAAAMKATTSGTPNPRTPLRSVLAPRALDDAGSMCFAMIEGERAGIGAELRPWIDNYLSFIRHGQFRLPDGTLARQRPLPNTLWLDDLYMSVPALVGAGRLLHQADYYDDAARQYTQFSARMFDRDKGLFMHGWVQHMEPHPLFPWARANGWAIITATELLDALPADHPARPAILEIFRLHARTLASLQGGDGLWHQLLNRPDSYPETSASAMYVYCFARGINQGWLDPLAYGPAASLGWNAVTKKVNAEGQVEGTCVGTGMGFDPMFYYYRPTSVYAAHGYGPVLLAAAEMITLRKGKGADASVNDAAVQFAKGQSPF